MFGYTLPIMCAHCLSDEFEELAKIPIEPSVSREVLVATACLRCREDGNLYDGGWAASLICSRPYRSVTFRRVVLPTQLVVDALTIATKCSSTTEWGMKSANADLQLTNLLSAERDPNRAMAYMSVGRYAIKDEHAMRHGSTTFSILEYLGLREARHAGRGTPWKNCRAPLPPQSASSGQAEEGDGATAGPDHLPPAGTATILEPRPVGAPPGLEPVAGAQSVAGAAVVMTPRSGVAAAEQAERIATQQATSVTGGVIEGITVFEPGTAIVTGQADETSAPIGVREAHARFPSMIEKETYLFNKDPRNLEAANTLRNKDVGNHQPSVHEAATRDEVVVQLCEQLFDKRSCTKAMAQYENLTKSSLPKKLSEEMKMQWQLDALNEADGDGVSFSKYVSAFVKAEVSAKPKPRPIANHKEIRLCALAKVAWTFEHVMFERLKLMSIKHRTKSQAMRDIAKNLSSMRQGRWCENDLTAFEFGIGEELKHAECTILRHIAKTIGIEETGALLFERVVFDREKPCVWSMRYRDETGEMKTVKLKLPKPMRESGDRLTSSGNFLQNVLAWMSFLMRAGDVKKAVATLIEQKGMRMFYKSARDNEKYLAMFIFEGDDTLGRVQEPIWEPITPGGESIIDDFFRRWGWKPKLDWKSATGDAYARVVGYDILIRDNKAVFDGDDLVACPEIKRLLTTKQWTTTLATAEERKTCNRIFAATLATDFTHMEPMHAFLKSMYDNNAGTAAVTDEMVREQALAYYGYLPEAGVSTLSSMEFPPFEGGSGAWKDLARVSAGDFTDLEWAVATAPHDQNVHGGDLATCYPRSWLS